VQRKLLTGMLKALICAWHAYPAAGVLARTGGILQTGCSLGVAPDALLQGREACPTHKRVRSQLTDCRPQCRLAPDTCGKEAGKLLGSAFRLERCCRAERAAMGGWVGTGKRVGGCQVFGKGLGLPG